MQASSIKLGSEYAANVSGKTVCLRVTDMITVRDTSKTVNYVEGWVDDKNGSRERVEKLPVSEVIDGIENHRQLMEEKQRQADMHKAKVEAAEAKQWLAVQLLAKAIGAQAVKERYGSYGVGRRETWDHDKPAVLCDGRALEVNVEALDNIIAYFTKVVNEAIDESISVAAEKMES